MLPFSPGPGARAKLLPPSVPYGFFLAGLIFQTIAWAVLGSWASQAAPFTPGPGPMLGALHAITVGALAMTAIGAAFQIVPVALGQTVAPAWLCRVVFAAMLAGTALFVIGFVLTRVPLITAGAIVVTAALTVFAVVLGLALVRARGSALVVRHLIGAVVCLFLVLVLGLAAVVDYSHALLPDHAAIVRLHMVAAVFGFMGLLAFGLSYILVPMFVLGSPSDDRLPNVSFGFFIAALLVAGTGAALDLNPLLALGAVLGGVAAGLHLFVMRGIFVRRMRKAVEVNFVLIVAAWIALPLGLTVGLAAVVAPSPQLQPRLEATFGFLVVVGWLLTFLLGVLQRITAFLATMHAAPPGAMPPLVSKLSTPRLLLAHAVCHITAVAAVTAGLLLASAALIIGGALLGALATLIFIASMAVTLTRARHHRLTAKPRTAPSRPIPSRSGLGPSA